MDGFGFGMMSFMPGDYLDMADVAFWDDTPGYDEPAYDEPARDVYEVDQYGPGHEEVDMEERRPIEDDWVDEKDEARSVAGRSVAAVSTGREDTLAPSSRNPGYAEESEDAGSWRGGRLLAGVAHALHHIPTRTHSPASPGCGPKLGRTGRFHVAFFSPPLLQSLLSWYLYRDTVY